MFVGIGGNVRLSTFYIILPVCCLSAACSAKTEPARTAIPEPGPTATKAASLEVDMVTIIPPGGTGTFRMGSTDEELAAQSNLSTDGDYYTDDEQPAHTVQLTVPYAIGKFEITNGEFLAVMQWALARRYVKIDGRRLVDSSGRYPLLNLSLSANFKTEQGVLILKEDPAPLENIRNHPVSDVSWYGAAAFANFLSMMNGLEPVYNPADWSWDNGKTGYRLPTEAEWEYAARGSQRYVYAWGNSMGPEYNLYGSTHTVGFFDGTEKEGKPTRSNASPFGVFDMTGNVWEWCWDWYGREYYRKSPGLDPAGPERGDDRPPYTVDQPTKVWRGGGLFASMNSGYLRIAKRWSAAPEEYYAEVGFRIARTLAS
jgi:formylglycine-generating enzyme required for sulfatase activity